MKLKTAFVATCLTGAIQAVTQQPNIVIVMADDLGWNHIGVPAATLNTAKSKYHTPHIKALADEGCSFPQAYMQANCVPTRACLLTGQYAPRETNGVYNVGSLNRYAGSGRYSKAKARFIGQAQSEDIQPGALTLARALKRNGYTTAHVGKYHVGGHDNKETLPLKMGFDINIGGGKQGHQPVCFAKKKQGDWSFPGLGGGAFDQYAVPYSASYVKTNDLPESLIGSPKHVSDAVGDAMVATIDVLASKDKPFYLEVHTYAVHGPVQARPDLKAAAMTRLAQEQKGKGKGKGKKVSGAEANYLGFISGLDENVGRLIQTLKDPNGDGDTRDSILDNTVVLFTSDNGGTHASNVPLKGAKGMHSEGGTRVPLIISWPGKIPAGTVSMRNVHAVDYYPTFLAFAGNKWTPSPETYPLDGYSFAEESFKPGTIAPRPPIYWFFPGYLDNRSQPLLSSVSSYEGKNYRLTYHYEKDAWSLYNLTDDLSETTDIAKTEPSIVRSLAKQAVAWLTQKTPLWAPKLPLAKSTKNPTPIPAVK